jgi:hypothetical protein
MFDPLLWLVAIAQNLVASFIAVLAGLAFARYVQERRDKARYGGWHVIVIKDGKTEVNRDISVRKAKEIFQETSDLSVFLKGVASPYGWINCDIIEKGAATGMLKRDDRQRTLTIDLDCNPPPSPPPGPGEGQGRSARGMT